MQFKNVTAIDLLKKEYDKKNMVLAAPPEPVAREQKTVNTNNDESVIVTSEKLKREIKARPAQPATGEGKDRFGVKNGSQAALIDSAVVELVEASISVVMEKTGLPKTRVATHFKWLTERGFGELKDGIFKLMAE